MNFVRIFCQISKFNLENILAECHDILLCSVHPRKIGFNSVIISVKVLFFLNASFTLLMIFLIPLESGLTISTSGCWFFRLSLDHHCLFRILNPRKSIPVRMFVIFVFFWLSSRPRSFRNSSNNCLHFNSVFSSLPVITISSAYLTTLILELHASFLGNLLLM